MIAARIAADPKCPFIDTRTQPVPGEGPETARILFVGEAPGENEDKTGRPLVGNAGRVFNKWLSLIGLPREEVFVTGLLKCHPPGNRAPRAVEVKHCLPYLIQQLEVIRPAVVCTMGSHALKALLGREARLTTMHGIPRERNGVVYMPLYHPAAAFYREELKAQTEADFIALGERLHQMGLLPLPPGPAGFHPTQYPAALTTPPGELRNPQ